MRNIETALAAAAALGIAATTAMTANAMPLSLSRQLNSAAIAQGGVVEKTQFVIAGRDYCFYSEGWHGPGFYWCGYSWRRGFGWGGPTGWHGWQPGRGGVYAGHHLGHGVDHGFTHERMEGRTGGPNGHAGVRGGGFQQHSQMNGTGGRTLQNNAAGMSGRTLQNNAAGMGNRSTGARGTMSPQGGAMGAHGGAGAGGAPGGHGHGAGGEH
jgi:hypothetical protein